MIHFDGKVLEQQRNQIWKGESVEKSFREKFLYKKIGRKRKEIGTS